jgi:hypothetical protein
MIRPPKGRGDYGPPLRREKPLPWFVELWRDVFFHLLIMCIAAAPFVLVALVGALIFTRCFP